MKTEARRGFSHGFNLTEQELRRIVSLMVEQLERATPGTKLLERFVVKFRNGAISEARSVDDVLELETFGAATIVRLDVDIRDRDEDPQHLIQVRFVNAETENENWVGLRYLIVGSDRDWVFVTSSQLDERVSKIKAVAAVQIVSSRNSLFLPLTMLSVLAIAFFGLASHASDPTLQVERLWKDGKLRDPIEACILIGRAQYRNTSGIGVIPFLTIAMILVTALLVPVLGYLYPAYNFVWGEYANMYSKRRAARTFIFTGVIVALVVSILAGWVVNRFHLGM